MPLIAQYCGHSLVSKLIKFQTRSIYSHTALLMDDWSVYEAWQDGGVLHNESLSTAHKPGTTVHLFELVEEPDWGQVYTFMLSQLGKDYDLPAVIRFVTRFQSKPNQKWFCSELVAEALLKGGVSLQNLPSSMLSPRDIGMSPLLRMVDEVVTTGV